MYSDTLKEILYSFNTATGKVVQQLEPLFEMQFFEKGSALHSIAHAKPTIYFLEHGLAKGTIESGNLKYVSWIIQQGFILPSQGLFKGSILKEVVYFLEDSSCWSLYLPQAELLANENPHLYQLLIEIYENVFERHRQTEILLRLASAKRRYELFNKQFPQLTGRLTNGDVASYLNVNIRYLVELKKFS